jgi:GxxExxY protein
MAEALSGAEEDEPPRRQARQEDRREKRGAERKNSECLTSSCVEGRRMNRQDPRKAREEPGEEQDRLAHAVIGAAIEVHRHLGPGFLESVYQKALEIEFRLRGIPAQPQYHLDLTYKEEPVGEDRLDFVVGGTLVVELKAVDALAPIHRAQVISYLRATGLRLGCSSTSTSPSCATASSASSGTSRSHNLPRKTFNSLPLLSSLLGELGVLAVQPLRRISGRLR